MNEREKLILYTDTSTKAIAGVLMQIQERIEKPCLFVSHALSEKASKWGIMELELYAFVYSNIYHPTCWGNNLSSEQITKTWSICLIQQSRKRESGEIENHPIRIQVLDRTHHIPGTSKVVTDGLTRVRWIAGRRHPELKRRIFKNDSIERIFCLGREDLLDVEDEVNDNLETKT